MNNYEYLLEQRVSRLEERLLALESAFRVLLGVAEGTARHRGRQGSRGGLGQMIKFIFWCIATPVFIAIAWMIGYALWGIASSLRDTYCVRWVYRDGASPRYGTNGTRPTADSSRPN